MMLILLFQVPLLETISTAKARGAVEKWLLELEGIMLRSIREVKYEELDMKEFGILNNLKNLIKCFRNKVWYGSGRDLQYPNIILWYRYSVKENQAAYSQQKL